MTLQNSQIPGQLRAGNTVSHVSRRGADAVAEVYKALKAISFYPENHPLRSKILQHAYQVLQEAMHGNDLSLVITRNGFSSTNGGAPVENTLAAKSLARELFTREVQRLSFLPDLSLREFQDFLSLLAVEPQKIVASGGMEKNLSEREIRNITTNEIDVSAVFTKRSVADSDTGEPAVVQQEGESQPVMMDFFSDFELPEMEIDEVLAAMNKEGDDDRYLKLAEMLLAKATPLKEQSQYEKLLTIVHDLIRQFSDTKRSQVKRNRAHAVFKQIAAGGVTTHLLRQLEDRECNTREFIYRVLHQLGEQAVSPAIERLNVADSIHARKALATALIRIGKPAVPSLLAMLRDARWYVVRGMLTILGEMRCTECVGELSQTLKHEDMRVRKEAIRCIAKTGGTTAADILIRLLSDKDPVIVKQVVFSLGILKSTRALEPLLGILTQKDFFLKSLPVKKEALQSLGLIGDKRVLPYLMEIARKKHWFAAKRWEELQECAVGVIAQLADESSRSFLQTIAKRGGRVGRSCIAALKSLGHENS